MLLIIDLSCEKLCDEASGSGTILFSKIVSDYDQEIPQSQTADKHMTQQGRATQPPGRQTLAKQPALSSPSR